MSDSEGSLNNSDNNSGVDNSENEADNNNDESENENESNKNEDSNDEQDESERNNNEGMEDQVEEEVRGHGGESDNNESGNEEQGEQQRLNNSDDDNAGDDGNNDEDNDSDDNDENEQDDEEQSKASHNSTKLTIGGSTKIPAFALLDGLCENLEESTNERTTIPLTRLPAVLGRTHSNSDENFFGLGKNKAVSRRHCVIDFRDDRGGKLACKSGTNDKMKYIKREPNKKLPEIIHGDQQELPTEGFFTVACLGKNAILVGGKRVGQGEVALLESGTAMRISSYSLYFLLPLNPPSKRRAIQITDEIPAATNKKRRDSLSSLASNQPSSKKPKAAPFSGLQAELDALDIASLLHRMNEAVKSEVWERKHQLIGSTIAVHAVQDATTSDLIRKISKQDGAVARGDIMQWIKDSPRYKKWVNQMLSKMEAKSYQNTITKALLKLGHVRTGSGGRYIKWLLSPSSTKKSSSKKSKTAATIKKESKQDDDSNDEDDDDDDDDNDNSDSSDNQDNDSDDDQNEKDSSGVQGEQSSDESGSSDDSSD